MLFRSIDAVAKERQESNAGEKLVYFYCNRAEKNRRDPGIILNTLIQQLAEANDRSILKPVVDIYEDRKKKGQTSACLTLQEGQDLLIKLTDTYPQTTICLDALNEVDNENRVRLLRSLKEVIGKSKNLVKIFATSRNDDDILFQFEMFPRIDLVPDDNVSDINEFIMRRVESVIDDGYLLLGVVSEELKSEICRVLRNRCKGM